MRLEDVLTKRNVKKFSLRGEPQRSDKLSDMIQARLNRHGIPEFFDDVRDAVSGVYSRALPYLDNPIIKRDFDYLLNMLVFRLSGVIDDDRSINYAFSQLESSLAPIGEFHATFDVRGTNEMAMGLGAHLERWAIAEFGEDVILGETNAVETIKSMARNFVQTNFNSLGRRLSENPNAPAAELWDIAIKELIERFIRGGELERLKEQLREHI